MTCKNATLPEILELSPRLEDADPGVRRLALIELADLELPEALPLLIAALRGDPDPGVRRLALIELADLELPEALPLLI
ncbi:HEAT repeat domain-containing protein, partial [Pseudomonas aeruginosa]